MAILSKTDFESQNITNLFPYRVRFIIDCKMCLIASISAVYILESLLILLDFVPTVEEIPYAARSSVLEPSLHIYIYAGNQCI